MPESLDLARLWAEFEDVLVPRLALTPTERVVYLHLVRRTRLVGERAVWLSKGAIARATLLAAITVRGLLRSLANKGCLRILGHGNFGYRLEPLLPEEILGGEIPAAVAVARPNPGRFVVPRTRRKALLKQQRGRCFYCHRRIGVHSSAIDHVIPRARGGDDAPENLVAACFECNFAKRDLPAGEFLRSLRASGRLSSRQLARRLAALGKKASGVSGAAQARVWSPPLQNSLGDKASSQSTLEG